MPTYVVRARAETLGPDRRRRLAEEITAAHARVTGAPRSFAQVVLDDLRGRDHYIGGRPSPAGSVFVHGHVRAGRDAATNAALVAAVRDAVTAVTGVGEDLVWVYLSEIPPERMVEFGRSLPAPGEEDAWIAGLPAELRARLGVLDAGAATGEPAARATLERIVTAAREAITAPDPFDTVEDDTLPTPAMLEVAAEEASRLRDDRGHATVLVRVVELVAGGDLEAARVELAGVATDGRLAEHVLAATTLIGPGTGPVDDAALVRAAGSVVARP